MKIDLSSVEIFESDEINFDKKITFIFGKNGTGKSTITDELRKLSPDYDVLVFQGFSNVIDENQRLNAVVLGEENASISRKIKDKKLELEQKNNELETIKMSLQEPNNDIPNFWTKKKQAEDEYEEEAKKIEAFYSSAATKIKNMEKPRVVRPTYNKRDFKEDVLVAAMLSEDELKQCEETIDSKVKNAPELNFPKIDFHK